VMVAHFMPTPTLCTHSAFKKHDIKLGLFSGGQTLPQAVPVVALSHQQERHLGISEESRRRKTALQALFGVAFDECFIV
jgi:hypothetical protein